MVFTTVRMMNNQGSIKTLLPLVEIIISIGIFAVAVALTLQMFLLAKFLGEKTSDTAMAIFEIQNTAEDIKLLKTDAEIENYIKNDVGNPDENGMYNLYYNGGWQRVELYSDAVFIMKISMNKDNYVKGELYNFDLALYKSNPYPFTDDKNIKNIKNAKNDENYVPLLASVATSSFIIGEY